MTFGAEIGCTTNHSINKTTPCTLKIRNCMRSHPVGLSRVLNSVFCPHLLSYFVNASREVSVETCVCAGSSEHSLLACMRSVRSGSRIFHQFAHLTKILTTFLLVLNLLIAYSKGNWNIFQVVKLFQRRVHGNLYHL